MTAICEECNDADPTTTRRFCGAATYALCQPCADFWDTRDLTTAPASPWLDWHLISVREPSPDTCEHGRPEHQAMLRQLAEALGYDLPALNATPEQVWNGLLDEVERLRRNHA